MKKTYQKPATTTTELETERYLTKFSDEPIIEILDEEYEEGDDLDLY
ncbi:MAG: hypothetical protein HUK01_06370 [Bacteroidaceae bacterium]|nr:hypothetical protein [Bacteroidaceae bacterium]